MDARVAAETLNAYCLVFYNDINMASTAANGSTIDAYDHKGHGTHKYIPAEKLTADLGEPEGAGVFAYWLMRDGSYLLRTCKGPLAFWSGDHNDKAEWGEIYGTTKR